MMKIGFIAAVKHLLRGKQNFKIEFEEVIKTAGKNESNNFVGENK